MEEIYHNQLISILNKSSLIKEADGLMFYFDDFFLKIDSNIDLQELKSNVNYLKIQKRIYNLYNLRDDWQHIENKLIEGIKLSRQEIHLDRFWGIDIVEKNGTIVARKNSERARIPANSFYSVANIKNETSNDVSTEIKEMVNVITSRRVINNIVDNGTSNDTEAYIFYYGKNILRDEFGEDTIRFYFNLKPNWKKIRRFIYSLAFRLDEREIPFQLKYLENLRHYKRADSIVLYVHKQNFSIVAQVVKILFNELDSIYAKDKILKEEVPLFTRKLRDGIGFVENPIEKGLSYGIHICNLILVGIINFIQFIKDTTSDYTPNNCLNFIIKNKYIDIEKPYINPNSSYFYNYLIFDKNHDIKCIKYSKKGNKYLQAAQFFAKLIEQKAIWIDGNTRTWMTYSKKFTDIFDNNSTLNFRPLNENERNGIEFFLDMLDYIISDKKNSHKPFPQINKDFKINIDFDDEFESSLLKMFLTNEPTPSFSSINLASKIAKKYADEYLNEYMSIGLPVHNRFGNYEFNPTITHGLAFYGYLFLRVYDEKNVPFLNDGELSKWLNINVPSNKEQ